MYICRAAERFGHRHEPFEERAKVHGAVRRDVDRGALGQPRRPGERLSARFRMRAGSGSGFRCRIRSGDVPVRLPIRVHSAVS
jgi:hypothetical protein